MKKKSIFIVTLAVMMLLTLGQSVIAFKDVQNDPNEQKIAELKQQGVLNGDGKHFKPNGKLTYAEGVSLIVRGLNLNIDHIRFIRAPKASDSFPNVKDDAWYSDAFIIAGFYDLGIPKSIKPNDFMTREQYAHHLMKAIDTTGEYAYVKIYLLIEDDAHIKDDYKNSIQRLLITKIGELNSSNKFNPTDMITRSEAAGWLYNAIQFVKNTKPIPPVPESPALDLELSVTPVNDDINKVTVTGEVPHPGYGIQISSISFAGTEAVIYVDLLYPDPDRMYPQVITSVQASTYVDSAYKPVLLNQANSKSSSSSKLGNISSSDTSSAQ